MKIIHNVPIYHSFYSLRIFFYSICNIMKRNSIRYLIIFETKIRYSWQLETNSRKDTFLLFRNKVEEIYLRPILWKLYIFNLIIFNLYFKTLKLKLCFRDEHKLTKWKNIHTKECDDIFVFFDQIDEYFISDFLDGSSVLLFDQPFKNFVLVQ